MAKIRYGIISDTHGNPQTVPLALAVLKHEGIDKLIVNGDLGTGSKHVAFTVDQVGKSGIESYLLPGSHERLAEFDGAMEYFKSRHPNLVNTFETQRVEADGHHLVFLSGSDYSWSGEYLLRKDDNSESGIKDIEGGGQIKLININDLDHLVMDPERTIVVSHVPRKFSGVANSVDCAYFAEAHDRSVVAGRQYEHDLQSCLGGMQTTQLKEVARRLGRTFKMGNRGNTDLREAFNRLGIKRGITGHFHESVHRAHDLESKPIKEGEPTDELFWNASYLDGLRAGILTVDPDANKLAYQNIDLRNYLQQTGEKE